MAKRPAQHGIARLLNSDPRNWARDSLRIICSNARRMIKMWHFLLRRIQMGIY